MTTPYRSPDYNSSYNCPREQAAGTSWQVLDRWKQAHLGGSSDITVEQDIAAGGLKIYFYK